MEVVSFVLSLSGFALFLWVAWALRSVRGDVRDLVALFRDAHGKGYPGPSAVVTEGRAPALGPAPEPEPEPEPAPARAALPAKPTGAALPVRVVPVTRDDDPVHTRPTIAAPSPHPPPHAPPVRVGAPAPETPIPDEPPQSRFDQAVARRFGDLVAEAQAEGKTAKHCHGAICLRHGYRMECPCRCEGCALVSALNVRAKRETRAAPGPLRLKPAEVQAGVEGRSTVLGVGPDDPADEETRVMRAPTAKPEASALPPGFAGLARARKGVDEDEMVTHEQKPGSPEARAFQGAVRTADALAGIVPEQPTSSASRAAREFAARGRTATLASAGVVPGDPLEARYRALCDNARGAGLAVDHCHRGECQIHAGDREVPPGIDAAAWASLGAVGLCACRCDGCARSTALLAQAEREVHGPPSGRRPC